MPDRVSSLVSAYRPGPYGAIGATGPGLTLSERRGLTMLLLACFSEDRPALSAIVHERFGLELPNVGKAQVANGVELLWQGPSRWLLQARERQHPELFATLTQAAAAYPAIAVTDLSHARSVIRLSGPCGRALLAKGCGLDLENGFNSGDCVMTRFSHYAVTLHASGADQIDLYVTRSFALALWEELLDLGAEYGLRVAEAG
ncbi:MAG TPA: sarcosine oxidase subunit gamma family protein [Kiloniellales bacterium]|jgi:heterotetrameric sarcosine oxidase gamma subunit|nr:sarcosine oxidase subunit gamma family protein [Kiloniellales bacterium]